MNNIADLKENIRNGLYNTYVKCGKNYKKYAETIEQFEKSEKLKTEQIPRDDVKTIWSN